MQRWVWEYKHHYSHTRSVYMNVTGIWIKNYRKTYSCHTDYNIASVLLTYDLKPMKDVIKPMKDVIKAVLSLAHTHSFTHSIHTTLTYSFTHSHSLSLSLTHTLTGIKFVYLCLITKDSIFSSITFQVTNAGHQMYSVCLLHLILEPWTC